MMIPQTLTLSSCSALGRGIQCSEGHSLLGHLKHYLLRLGDIYLEFILSLSKVTHSLSLSNSELSPIPTECSRL